ncbi:SLATT domain-containing protein [Streptomyces cacaoi]|uniref:SLATT domain-containing protein n=1 Tax=Streptomyces cacaoi TaxID=1898 RepID=UPI0036FE1A17
MEKPVIHAFVPIRAVGRGPESAEGVRVRQPDLLGRGFPSGDWEEPAERLEELYHWVEEEALALVEWYLADRARKRRWARVLRAGTAAGAAAGAALPLLETAGLAGGPPDDRAAALGPVGAAGYLGLLLAVVCLLADRWLGLTSGWMRSVAAAQAVQRRLEALRYAWAAERIREVLGPTDGSAGDAAERALGLLRRFSEDVSELVRGETTGWMVEFRTGPGSVPLHLHTPGRPGPHRAGSGRPAPGRHPLPPAGPRPHMPRQRPPGG